MTGISNCAVERTVGRVVNGDNDTRGKDNLLPGLANVEDIDTVRPGLPQVRLHVHLEVLCAEMALGSEEHLNVLLGGVEDGGEVGRSHFDGLALYKLVDVRSCRVACERTFGGGTWRCEYRPRLVGASPIKVSVSVAVGRRRQNPLAGLGSAKDSSRHGSDSVASHAASNTTTVVPAGVGM